MTLLSLRTCLRASTLMLLVLLASAAMAAPPTGDSARNPLRIHKDAVVEAAVSYTFSELYAVEADERMVLEGVSLWCANLGGRYIAYALLQVRGVDGQYETLMHMPLQMTNNEQSTLALASGRYYLFPGEQLWFMIGLGGDPSTAVTFELMASGYTLPEESAELSP